MSLQGFRNGLLHRSISLSVCQLSYWKWAKSFLPCCFTHCISVLWQKRTSLRGLLSHLIGPPLLSATMLITSFFNQNILCFSLCWHSNATHVYVPLYRSNCEASAPGACCCGRNPHLMHSRRIMLSRLELLMIQVLKYYTKGIDKCWLFTYMVHLVWCHRKSLIKF